MTSDERARATVLALEAQRDKLTVWLAKRNHPPITAAVLGG